jgi:hypothetical protein
VPGGIPIRWLRATVGPPFRIIARLRRQRAFHPRGVVLDAVVAEAGASLTPLRAGRAVVRLSRAAGLPDSLPDVAGLAVRVLDAGGSGLHQDLLLSTVGTRRPLHHLLRFTRRPGAATYSTVLPTRVDGVARLLTGRLEGPGVASAAGLDGLAAAVDEGGAVVHLDAVPLLRGPARRLMTLHLGRRLEPPEDGEELRFSPANAGAGLTPIGLTALRDAAYRGSSRGRAETGNGG